MTVSSIAMGFSGKCLVQYTGEYTGCSVRVEDGAISIDTDKIKIDGKWVDVNPRTIESGNINSVTIEPREYSVKRGGRNRVSEGKLFSIEYENQDGTKGVNVIHMNKDESFTFSQPLDKILKNTVVIHKSGF